MKDQLRKLASPLLDLFESGEQPYSVKPSHRTILLATSVLFLGLSGAIIWVALGQAELTYLIPALVFGSVGLVGIIIGLLGNDRAVAKIWGNK